MENLSVTAEIRAELARRKASYSDVAKELGTTRQNIWRRLSDDSRAMTDTELGRFANFLGLPAWELMRRAEENDTKALADSSSSTSDGSGVA